MLGNLTSEQLEAYAIHHSILDLTKQIDSGSFHFDPEPEAEPQYDSNGRLINTPQERQLKAALLRRTELVQKAIQIIPNYQPPVNFRSVHKTSEKIFLPVAEHPELNFVGLLLGPRGRTLQRMEKESGARISIRGRGSSKTASLDHEDLHCIVSSDTPSALEKAKIAVAEVVNAAINKPENENEFKRNQLRELATLNGTLRQELCNLCGSPDHRRADCSQKIICRACQGEGHFARDCKAKRAAEDLFENMFEDVKRHKAATPETETREASPSNQNQNFPSQSPQAETTQPQAGAPPGIGASIAPPPGLPTMAPPGIAMPLVPPSAPPANIAPSSLPPPPPPPGLTASPLAPPSKPHPPAPPPGT